MECGDVRRWPRRPLAVRARISDDLNTALSDYGHADCKTPNLDRLADLARLKVPEAVQGTSLLPLLKDVSSNDWKKEAAFTVAEGGGESLRTATWRYTQWGFGADGCELYDLKPDSGEFINLANHPEYATQLNTMKEALEKRRLEVGYQGAVTQEHADKKKAVAAARAQRKKKK